MLFVVTMPIVQMFTAREMSHIPAWAADSFDQAYYENGKVQNILDGPIFSMCPMSRTCRHRNKDIYTSASLWIGIEE